MSTQSAAECARAMFEAFLAKDREGVECLMADDFTFTSPYDDAIDRAQWFERCWPNSDLIQSIDVLETATAGDKVFVLYRCVTREGTEFRNTELFTFDGDRIRSVEVFFGASYRDGTFIPKQ